MSMSISGNVSPSVWDAIRKVLGTWHKNALIRAYLDARYTRGINAKWNDPAYRRAMAIFIRRHRRFTSHDALVQSCMAMVIETDTCSNDFYEYYVDRGGVHTVNIKGVK